jgi:hypothetical protein
LYSSSLDIVQTLVDVLKLLHTQPRFRRISTEGFISEYFEDMDEDDLAF